MENNQILIDLTERYGELVGGVLLSKILGFTSLDAMKRSIERGSLNLPTFFIKGRRGRFALTIDVARWLMECKANADLKNREIPKQFKKNVEGGE